MTLLALARFFAPEPVQTPAPDQAAQQQVRQTETAGTFTDEDGTLRKIVFLPTRTLQASPAAVDLRDPFADAVRVVRTSAPDAPPRSPRSSKASVRHDLRDPFAEKPPKRRLPAPDLRDPFETRPLPKCPETGGVPIQRPASVQARCAQASKRTVVLAHR